MEHSELFCLMFPKFPTEQKGQIKLYKLNKEKNEWMGKLKLTKNCLGIYSIFPQ